MIKKKRKSSRRFCTHRFWLRLYNIYTQNRQKHLILSRGGLLRYRVYVYVYIPKALAGGEASDRSSIIDCICSQVQVTTNCITVSCATTRSSRLASSAPRSSGCFQKVRARASLFILYLSLSLSFSLCISLYYMPLSLCLSLSVYCIYIISPSELQCQIFHCSGRRDFPVEYAVTRSFAMYF